MVKLGGILFIKDGIKYDYCYREAIGCLKSFCDETIILDAGSEDGTKEDLLSFADEQCQIVAVDKELWNRQHGREKLAYFQNVALSFLNTEYYFLLQADEIVHESCFDAIRKAVATGDESFLIRRFNLWGSPDTYISVPENKQPCSTEIIRLAKTKYFSVGDGEGIEAPANHTFVEQIRMYHYGFVRKKQVMKAKVINMQEGVFELGYHDPKLDQSEVFDSKLWFDDADLAPITEPHPKFIKDWISNRP